ncbi:Asp23/Gls24 family envelope stress response protein [Petroclostridium sp. X23]|uniref:Asp23/Gls24 family envelope stress response protein n=1 Tax=Petroclostridium sp. X23 TaxID=3045146 RepID=UPI0024AD2253|nr:Asp23/Gls24 family envelope stress response protein [Petroclostridium sp. X23]WHH57544.1 Asp23/Gls24 family envelope stress response protein [Petroclostridium sp. X23]
MQVIAFIGPSGSGKSYRAMWVAQENNINYIIDDGLLIKGNRVLAGFSAKKEQTRLASVRRALFIEGNHVQQVMKAIDEENPPAMLILGTSQGMVEAIVGALKLPGISRIIRIEDVAEKDEIEKARTLRRTEGKHVIPVPTFEIKKDFSGYLLDPLKIFRRKGKNEIPQVVDKSVVRPTFSYMGNYTISNQVIITICEFEAMKIAGVKKISKVWLQNDNPGLAIHMELTLEYGNILQELAKEIQVTVRDAVEKYTAINVLAVNITVKSLVVQGK